MIIYNKKIFKKIISKEDIEKKITDISKSINNYYGDNELVILCVLNGSVMLLNDLLIKLKTNHIVDYIELSSYKGGTETSGKIDIVKDVATNL